MPKNATQCPRPGLEPQICPGLNANEIQIPHNKHHKESSLVKSHQNTHNSVRYEVIRKCQITLLSTN